MDMLLMYGHANCNCMAKRLYDEHFPRSTSSNHKTFATVDHWREETGIFKPASVDWGRERAIWTPDMEKCVLDHVHRDGRDSVINIPNHHHFTEGNLHGIIYSRHQQQFSINVWAGITGDCFVGLLVLSHRLTDNGSRDFYLLYAKATGSCTTGSQVTNVVHVWWCSGTF
jgi:hypothetical protein